LVIKRPKTAADKFVRGAVARGYAIEVGKRVGSLGVVASLYPLMKATEQAIIEHRISPTVGAALLLASAAGIFVGGKAIIKANKAELRLFLKVQGRPLMADEIALWFDKTNKEFAGKLRASGAIKQRLNKAQIEEAVKFASKNHYLHPLHT